jgi:hypothetical protein
MMKLTKETMNGVNYNREEDIWWVWKNDMLTRFVEVLVKIFKETLRPDMKRIFNITLLIRQNFLTLCETPELMTSLFGQPYVWYWNDEIEDYVLPSRLENEVIDGVMNKLELEDAEYDEVFKD